MFEGFQHARIETSGATIQAVYGGTGPAVLLLHGYPQTHVIWHKIAPRLAERYTVVATDLRGYGDSSKPPDGTNHSGYAKRATAQDQVEVLAQLGFSRFAVVGHDRGARVAHRMALDHADRVSHLAVLDIVPTYHMFHHVTRELATSAYHWFFLIQPEPFPETLIGNSVEYFLRRSFSRAGEAITQEAADEYLRCFRDPATIHATCEDYRAAASIDLEHDAADRGRKLRCPLLALWGDRGSVHGKFDVLTVWREYAEQVSGHVVPSGHYVPEEAPEETVAAMLPFLQQ